MKRAVSAIIALIIAVLPTLSLTSFAKKNDTVKVGYYLSEDFQEMKKNGTCSGYAYEYLHEISQYNSWKYKYVVKSENECKELLKNKQIDIICGVSRDDAYKDYFDYSSYSIGAVQYILYTKYNSGLKYENYDTFEDKKIGVIDDSISSNKLNAFCKSHSLKVNAVKYSDDKALEAALSNDEIDAVFSKTNPDLSDNRIIARSESTAIYIATWKGNKLISKINNALWQITNNSPYFESELKEKYSDKKNNEYPVFTKNELDYINSSEKIMVAYDKERCPVEYYDEKSKKMRGVSFDVLNLIEEYSGLNFIYCQTDTFSEAASLIKSNSVDLIASINRDYQWSAINNVLLSNSYYYSSTYVIRKKNAEKKSKPTIAIVSGYYFAYHVSAKNSQANILYYDSVEECVEAVKKGRADEVYLCGSEAEYYLSFKKFSNLYGEKVNGYESDISIAVSKSENEILLSIINKSLACISNEKINNIVVSNLTDAIEDKNSSDTAKSNILAITLSVVITAIFVLGIVFLYLNAIKKKQNAEKSKEHDALTGLYNRESAKKYIEKHLEDESADEDYISPIFVVNLDNYKQIIQNEGFVHADKLLLSVAEILKQCVRSSDIVARIGKDEFLIYLCDLKEISVVNMKADMICKKIRVLGENNEKYASLTASVGVACKGDEYKTYSEILSKANEALKEAKENGKNRYVVFDTLVK